MAYTKVPSVTKAGSPTKAPSSITRAPATTNAPSSGGVLTANAGPDATLVYGTATALAASASGGTAPYTHAWTVLSVPNDGLCVLSDAASATSNATLTGPNGTFTLRYTVTDSLGATATDDVVLTLNAATLAAILGSNVTANWDAYDLANGAVASWASTGSDTAAFAPVSASPVRAATSFNSAYPGVTCNGSTQEMLATLGSAIPSGSRPYVFVVGQFVALPAGGTQGIVLQFATPTTGTNRVRIGVLGTGALWRYDRITVAGSDADINSAPADLLPHVLGIGWPTDRLTFAIDGCMSAGTGTQSSANDDTLSRVRLGGLGGSSYANIVYAQIIVCGTLPNAQQISAVNAFLRNKWGLPTTIVSSTEAFDLVQLDSDFATGDFAGAEYCNGKVYMLPWNGGAHNKVLQWDTTKPWRNTSSWTKKDLTPLGAGANGFCTGCNDGTYVYIAPINSKFFRIDSRLDATLDAAYKKFDLKSLNAGASPPSTSGGCVYDGSRYVYIAPLLADDLDGKIVVRYDTLAGDFESASSYEKFDLTEINSACRGYLGIGFDGRYVYLSPYANNGVTHGQFVRYDTTQPFGTGHAASWERFDLTGKDAALKGINGIVCVGTKVYLVPGEVTYGAGDGSVGAMYDTAGSFTANGSYATFDFHNVNALSQGFMFAFYDGSRYIYYPQEHQSNSAWVRQDTQGSYTSAASYKMFDHRYVGSAGAFVGGGVADSHIILTSHNNRYAVKTYGQPAT